MGAAEAGFIQFEQGQVSPFTDRQLADIRTSEQLCRAFGGHRQGIGMGEFVSFITQPLDQHRLTHFLHQVAVIVGGTAIDTQPHRRAGLLQLPDPANARRQYHVGRRAMANAGTHLPQPRHLLVIEMDTVGQPGAIVQPADTLEIIQRALAKLLRAEGILVIGLGKMGVQSDIVAAGQFGAGAHDVRRH